MAAVTGVNADHISAIRNWVCPECGGPMGGRSQEFQCHGRCGRDWRSVWESASIEPKRKIAITAAQNLVASLSGASSLITRSCRDFSLGRKRAVPGLLRCIGTLDSTSPEQRTLNPKATACQTAEARMHQ
jgi:hypothetical protein